ncbi:MAG: hypothetical protein E6Q91_05285 [Actinobacteria bacterium]|nr:MAG: hypothetical protein E6Q91_05285 [Actinomycetota bacterium]
MTARLAGLALSSALVMSGFGLVPVHANDGGTLWAWGSDPFGYGFMGSLNPVAQPLPAPVDLGVVRGKRLDSISADTFTSCVVAAGDPYCWGYNVYGQLGDGTTANSPKPVAVQRSGVLAGKTIQSFSPGGAHTCALADGKPYCWGLNVSGQVGDGTTTNRLTPVAVDTTGALAGRQVTALTTGDTESCVVADGAPFCWGERYDGAGLVSRLVPTAIPDPSGYLTGKTVTSLSAGLLYGCLVAAGTPYCWGRNSDGQLGDGTFAPSAALTPVDMSGALAGKTVTTVRAGLRTTCAVADGAAYCWGDNQFGQVGDGTTDDRPSPVAVAALAGRTVTGIRVGSYFTCAVGDAKLLCWGRNDFTGTGQDSTVPVEVPAFKGKEVLALAVGNGHALALTTDRPTAPQAASASRGDARAVVSWQPPADDGGRPVTGYVVTASPGGARCQTSGLSCVVSGLQNGTPYELDVVARNAVGDSPGARIAVTPLGVQKVKTPKRVKKRGVTVILKKGARTSAGVPVATKVKAKGKVKVIRKGGAVTVKPLGKKWRVTVTLSAPGTDTHEPFSQKVVYKNGKRR